MTLTAEDKISIHETISNCYYGIDDHKPDEFAACFAKDGVFEAKYGRFEGRADIAAFMVRHIANGGEDNARHCLTNMVVSGTGEMPTIRCYVSKFRIDQKPAPMIGNAALLGYMVKVNGGWFIKKLELEIKHNR